MERCNRIDTDNHKHSVEAALLNVQLTKSKSISSQKLVRHQQFNINPINDQFNFRLK